jgi:hypothetical protein
LGGNYRTPDIYFERVQGPDKPRILEKVKVDVPAFLGYATRGAIGTPIHISSWKSFEDAFGGHSNDAYLPAAVYGFFLNGGRECYVIRVAHLEGEDAAAGAKTTLSDLYGRPTIRATALDPGEWGNKIRIKCVQASKPPRTRIRAKLESGATESIVDVVKGFEPGAVVKISDGDKADYAVLKKIDKKKLVWASDQAIQGTYDTDKTVIEGVEVQLQVATKDKFEIHDNLVFHPAHSRSLVKTVSANSRLVQLESLKSGTPPPFNYPVLDVETMLAGGRDGAEQATAADFIGWDRGLGHRGGLLALEDVEEVGLICAPDLISFKEEREVETVQRAILDFCERRKTCFAILDMPQSLDMDQARDWRQNLDSKYGAIYYPWLKVIDPIRGRGVRLVPPCGHVAGVYSRTDQALGVHKAPANEVLNEVVGLTTDLVKDTTDILSPEGVNCIRAFRGRGIRIWGARTLSSDKAWDQVNVRRLFIMVERSIAEGSEWVTFENNDYKLWKTVERQVSKFLYDLWKEGMLKGAVPEEAFWVKCDETTNPPQVREAGEFFCEIGIAPVRPAEFIIFKIGQRTKDIVTEEPVG